MIEGKIETGLVDFLNSKAHDLIDEEEADLFDLFQRNQLTEQKLLTPSRHDNIPDLKIEIRKSISQIIEKKALINIKETLQSKSKLPVLHFYKPDVDLNLYINNLKTNLEKVLALKTVGDRYVGMLSKSYQEIRKKARGLFTEPNVNVYFTHPQEVRSVNIFDNISVCPVTVQSNAIKKDAGGQKEVAELDHRREEDELIISKKSDFDGFPNVSPKTEKRYIYLDQRIKGKSQRTITKYMWYFHENASNIDKMRSHLHVVPQEFLEKWICSLFIQNNLHIYDDPAFFFSIFFCIAGNPLNEIRILDIILKLISMDASNEKTLTAFNEVLGTNLNTQEYEKSRGSFLRWAGQIFEKYYKLTIAKRNGLEIEHYGDVAEKIYAVLGVQPFKSKLPNYLISTKTGRDNYLERYLRILSKSGHLGQEMDDFVRFCLDLTYINFASDYFAGNQQMWVKIFELIKLMACIDPRSSVAKKLLWSIGDCLQNEQIFLNFIALVQQQEEDPIFQKIISKLSPVLQKLHSLAKTLPAYDKQLFEQSMPEIRDILSLRQALIIVKLLFDRMTKMSEEMQYLKEKNLIDDNIATYTKIQHIFSSILENNNLKRLFSLLANILTVSEKIRSADTKITSTLKDSLSDVLELTLSVYRGVRLQKDIDEKLDQIEFNSSMAPLVQKPLNRVASKCEEDEPLREKSTGIGSNFGEIETDEEIKYEELFTKLSIKAKTLMQEIIPESYETETSSKGSFFAQFPWLLSFAKKRAALYRQLENLRVSVLPSDSG